MVNRPITKLNDKELYQIMEYARLREAEGDPETPVRNWQIAALITEIIAGRIIADKYGTSNKIDELLSDSEHPLRG